jgi:hypothetical protein
MISRILAIGTLPELRSDPVAPEKNVTEIEVAMEVDLYWELQELIAEMRYTHSMGVSTDTLWHKFSKKIVPCILLERDRLWFRTNIGV